jgi:sugar transferase (PEP-CTERM/EpsH1 system associated)
VKVLYLCHRIPYPPDKGDKIRAFHQLRAIAGLHEVDLFTLADRPEDLVHQSALARFCRHVTVSPISPRLARLRALPYLLTRTPLTLPYFHCSELEREVRSALEKRSYDRIFVYCSAMAQYVEGIRTVPVVTDFVDVDSDKWTQYAAFQRFPFSVIYRREGKRLRDYERKVCERSSCVLVTTEREVRLVRQISGAAPVHVVENGVDTNYFAPPTKAPDSTVPAIVFTGDMSYFPNEEAVTFFTGKVLPLIRRRIPDVRFYIVGRNPGPNVLRLEQAGGVEVTGFVPDIRPYLAKARVSVAPFSIAAGIQNKILEAMAYGLPVVATVRAVQGLSEGVAQMVKTGESPEELAGEIIGLLNKPELARQTGLEARRRVAADYNWDRALERLLQLLEHPQSTLQMPEPARDC